MEFERLFNLGKNKILVLGDIMLDIYQYGNCNRISPEAPVPILDFVREEIMLGGAGNVLKNLVSFGANCEIISVIGDDLSGRIILDNLKHLKIDSELLIIDKSRVTTEKKRFVSSGQQLLRIDKENKHNISVEIENKILEYVKSNIFKYDVILFSDYMKGVLTERICKEIINFAKSNSIITMSDPKGSNCNKYKNIDLIKPNLKEAELLTKKKIETKEDIENACFNLKKMFRCKKVVITLAENGIALLEETFHIKPTKVSRIHDVSGAGDTVLAALAICLKQNYSLQDSCVFANKAASIVIRNFGSVTTSVKEVIDLI